MRLTRNDLSGYVPTEITQSLYISELSLSDNYLAGLGAMSDIPTLSICDISKNFLVCPISPWIEEQCGGICGQSLINNNMNTTREIQRAAMSGSSDAYLFFMSGYYGTVNMNFVAIEGQNVEFSVYDQGSVTVSGSSQFTFKNGNSFTLRGFAFENITNNVVSTTQTASVYIQQCAFSGNR